VTQNLEQDKQDLAPEERRAIAALRRLEKIWPKSLMLVHHQDSAVLLVCRAENQEDVRDLPVIARVQIRTNSCL